MGGSKPGERARHPEARAGRALGARARVLLPVTLAVVVLLAAIAAVSLPRMSPSGSTVPSSSTAHADRVDVIYFHRTERCESCLWTGNAVGWTVRTYFADELASGRLTYREVDVQKAENAALAQKYRATGPSLFLSFVKDGKESIVQASDTYPFIGNTERFSDKLRSRIASGLGVE